MPNNTVRRGMTSGRGNDYPRRVCLTSVATMPRPRQDFRFVTSDEPKKKNRPRPQERRRAYGDLRRSQIPAEQHVPSPSAADIDSRIKDAKKGARDVWYRLSRPPRSHPPHGTKFTWDRHPLPLPSKPARHTQSQYRPPWNLYHAWGRRPLPCGDPVPRDPNEGPSPPPEALHSDRQPVAMAHVYGHLGTSTCADADRRSRSRLAIFVAARRNGTKLTEIDRHARVALGPWYPISPGCVVPAAECYKHPLPLPSKPARHTQSQYRPPWNLYHAWGRRPLPCGDPAPRDPNEGPSPPPEALHSDRQPVAMAHVYGHLGTSTRADADRRSRSRLAIFVAARRNGTKLTEIDRHARVALGPWYPISPGCVIPAAECYKHPLPLPSKPARHTQSQYRPPWNLYHAWGRRPLPCGDPAPRDPNEGPSPPPESLHSDRQPVAMAHVYGHLGTSTRADADRRSRSRLAIFVAARRNGTKLTEIDRHARVALCPWYPISPGCVIPAAECYKHPLPLPSKPARHTQSQYRPPWNLYHAWGRRPLPCGDPVPRNPNEGPSPPPESLHSDRQPVAMAHVYGHLGTSTRADADRRSRSRLAIFVAARRNGTKLTEIDRHARVALGPWYPISPGCVIPAAECYNRT